jgi:hypothetical protein
MADTERVEIIVDVDDKGAIRVFNQLGKEIEFTEKRAAKASQSFTGLSKTFERSIAAAFSLRTAIAAINRAGEIADVADSFQAVGGSAADIEKAIAATGGLVRGINLTNAAIKGLASGAPEFGKFIPLVAKLGTQLSNLTAENPTDVINNLTTALVTGGRGIEQYSAFLGISRKQIQAWNKEGVTYEKLIEAFTKKTGELPPVVLNTSETFDVFINSLLDLKDRTVATLASNDLLKGGLEETTKVVDGLSFQDIVAGMADVAGAALLAANEVGGLAVKLLGLGSSKAKGEFYLGAQYFVEVLKGSVGLGDPDGAAEGMKKAFRQQLEEMAARQKKTNALTKDGTVAMTAEQKAFKVRLEQYKEFVKSLMDTGDTATKAKKAIDALDKSAFDNTKTMGVLLRNQTDGMDLIDFEEEAAAISEEEKKFRELQASFANSIASGAAGGIGDALSAALTGGDFKQGLSSALSSATSMLGSYFGPIGSAAGGVFGDLASKWLFGGSDRQTAIRSAATLLAPVTGGLSLVFSSQLEKAFGGGQNKAANARKAFG